jgi:hypothetical protein
MLSVDPGLAMWFLVWVLLIVLIVVIVRSVLRRSRRAGAVVERSSEPDGE